MPNSKNQIFMISRRNLILAGSGLLLSIVAGFNILGRHSRNITGKMLGATSSAGHLLREKFKSLPETEETVDVVIVGGGIAGLSAARKLSKSGFKNFVLLELEPEVGGNSRFGENRVSAYPWGAHYVPLPGPKAHEVRDLFEEFGIITGYGETGLPCYDEFFICAAPQERLFMNGHWQEGLLPQIGVSASDKAEYQRFFDIVEHYKTAKGFDGRRAFEIPIDFSSRDPSFLKLDQISMDAFLKNNGFLSEPFRWYLDYCCRDDYGSDLENTSAWAGLHYFASRNGEGDGIHGYQVLTWPEGNGWLVKKLKASFQSSSNPTIRQNSVVRKISRSGESTAVDYQDSITGKAHRINTRAVIYAAPRFTASHVIDGYLAQPQFEYVPWLVANITVSSLPEGHGAPLSWDNVIYQSSSLGYVVATHQSLASRLHETVLTYYRPFNEFSPQEARKWASEKTHDDWRVMIVNDLTRAHYEIADQIENIDVWLWGHAMIRPRPGFIWGKARKDAAEPFGNIYFAHSDMSGISIFEEAHFWGNRAAESVLKKLGVKNAMGAV